MSSHRVELSSSATCPCCQPQVQLAAPRINRELSRRGFLAGVGASLATLGLFRPKLAQAAPESPARPLVFRNVLLFAGKSDKLRGGLRVLVEGNRIAQIGGDDAAPPGGARIIDCGGRVMMPGLIDAHWHAIFAALPVAALLTAPRSPGGPVSHVERTGAA